MAIVSTVDAVENFGQKLGPGPILDLNNNPKPGDDNFKFNPGSNVNPGHKPDNDFNQWDKNRHNSNHWDKGHGFKFGYHGYWNYPYYWYHQFMPYYYQYWYYPSWNHHPDDQKKH